MHVNERVDAQVAYKGWEDANFNDGDRSHAIIVSAPSRTTCMEHMRIVPVTSRINSSWTPEYKLLDSNDSQSYGLLQ